MPKETWKTVIDQLPPAYRAAFKVFVMRTRRLGIEISMNGTTQNIKRSLVVAYLRGETGKN